MSSADLLWFTNASALILGTGLERTGAEETGTIDLGTPEDTEGLGEEETELDWIRGCGPRPPCGTVREGLDTLDGDGATVLGTELTDEVGVEPTVEVGTEPTVVVGRGTGWESVEGAWLCGR